MKRMLLLIAVLVMSILACGGSGSTTQATRAPRETITVSAGELRSTIRNHSGTITKDTIIKVQKLDGTYDSRQNDLLELCLDFIYYRDQILKETAKGNTSKADSARNSLNQVSNWLDAYHESDVEFMWTFISEKGW